MRYIKLSVIGLLSIFMFASIVNAESPFNYKFETTSIQASKIDSEYFDRYYRQTTGLPTAIQTPEIEYAIPSFSNVISYRDGYLGVDIVSAGNKKGTNITYYDKDGKIIKTKLLENYYIISDTMSQKESTLPSFEYFLIKPIVIHEKDIYCTAIYSEKESYNGITLTIKIDEDFNIAKEVAGARLVNVTGNYVYVNSPSTYDDTYNIFDLDLEHIRDLNVYGNSEDFESEEEHVKYITEQYGKIFPDKKWIIECYFRAYSSRELSLARTGTLENYELFQYFLDANENYALFADYQNFNGMEGNTGLILLTRDGKIKKLDNITIDYYTLAFSVKFVHNYIVISDSIDCSKTRLRVYDTDGELVQKTEKNTKGYEMNYGSCIYDERYANILETTSGFSVLRVSEAATMVHDLEYGLFTPSTTSYHNEVYTLHEEVPNRTITVKIKGKGNIVVPDTADAGALVTYLVDCPDGYQLKSLVIYDSRGNKIDKENLSFTMIDDNVIIEAEFVPILKENPKTGIVNHNILITILIGISILSYNFVRKKIIKRI